eukprot:3028134-Ditylum_brightwellii.AAC.1
MTTVAKLLKQPYILYNVKFKHSNLEQVQFMQVYDGKSGKTMKCSVFSGVDGIEGLLRKDVTTSRKY